MSAEVNTRPIGVTIVAVVTLVEGVLNIVRGIISLATADATSGRPLGGHGGTITLAVINILIGLAIVVMASGLLRGNRRARKIMSVIILLSIIVSVLVIVIGPAQWLLPAITIALGLVALFLLWTGRGKLYFRSRKR